jgi:hypothetical protein
MKTSFDRLVSKYSSQLLKEDTGSSPSTNHEKEVTVNFEGSDKKYKVFYNSPQEIVSVFENGEEKYDVDMELMALIMAQLEKEAE